MSQLRGGLSLVVETTLELLRSKVLFPILVVALVLSFFANTVSDWGVAEFERILFDVGLLGFHLVGAFLSIFWGVTAISGARENGSVETTLAAPISRFVWFLGRYFGLLTALSLASIVFVIIWQTVMLYYDFDWLGWKLSFFWLQTLCWWVLGALAMFWATITQTFIAIFCSCLLRC